MVRITILAVALAATLCGGSACVELESGGTTPPRIGGRRTAPHPPDAALVDELDRGIQTRFKNVRDEDIRTRNLGTSRVAVLGLRNRGILRTHLNGELRSVSRIATEGWITAVYVVEPQPDGTIYGPLTASSEDWGLFPRSDGVREAAERAMVAGVPVRGKGRAVALEARPVPASEPMCLRCHRGAELGEPLGAVVYAFRDAVLPSLLERSNQKPVTLAARRDIRSGRP